MVSKFDHAILHLLYQIRVGWLNAEAASVQWHAVANQIWPKVPKLATIMDEAEHDVLAYMTFPKEHRVKLHSINPIERLNGEIKRRTEVVGIFPNDDAIVRLVGALEFVAGLEGRREAPADPLRRNDMAKAIQKITLDRSRDVPFDKLELSQKNVRNIKAGVSIEDLVSDIALRGLLMSLNVRPIVSDDDEETGRYEVPAGGRRYRALELLIKQKRMAKTEPIPCIVKRSSATSVEDDSLAENVHRLHPLDQFRAFQTMIRLLFCQSATTSR
jgi:ParB/RepB/Spo0J family partition protein